MKPSQFIEREPEMARLSGLLDKVIDFGQLLE